MKTAFEWVQGYHAPRGLRAEVAGRELERLRKTNRGRLTPAAVVTAAKSKLSVLHRVFEWDNKIAADTYRREQAATLIRSISVVEIADERGTPKRGVRAFVHVEDQRGRGYTSTVEALADPQLREHVLREALGELQSWRSRYEQLKEMARVVDAISAVEKGIDTKGQRLLKVA